MFYGRGRIGPQDQLPAGARVIVSGKLGFVVEADWGKDQFGGNICRHKITLTHKRGTGPKQLWEPLKKQITAYHNYSFIYVQSA